MRIFMFVPAMFSIWIFPFTYSMLVSRAHIHAARFRIGERSTGRMRCKDVEFIGRLKEPKHADLRL